MAAFDSFEITERLSSDLTGLVFQPLSSKFKKINRSDASDENKYDNLADACRERSYNHYNCNLLAGLQHSHRQP
jgi:hypothetical protein